VEEGGKKEGRGKEKSKDTRFKDCMGKITKTWMDASPCPVRTEGRIRGGKLRW
jgi:hypothetical protein